MIVAHIDDPASCRQVRSRPPRPVMPKGEHMPSSVSEPPAASPDLVAEHYARRLALETDCWDVHEALSSGTVDFVLLDVRGPLLYQHAHVPGAINLPHGKITASRMEAWPVETLFVVYCAGPHCNGTDRAALRLARLGRRVKVMIGGLTGWADEGFAVATGSETGGLAPQAA
jgi:rhodanese-related sulfurtransferase